MVIRISKNRLDMAGLPIRNMATGTFSGEFDNGNVSGNTPIDWKNGQKQKITLTGNVSLNFSNPDGPCNILLKIVQSGVGSNTVSWPGNVKWSPGGSIPALTPALGAIDIVSFYFDGSGYFGAANLNFA